LTTTRSWSGRNFMGFSLRSANDLMIQSRNKT
jgi:hypothetical protein